MSEIEPIQKKARVFFLALILIFSLSSSLAFYLYPPSKIIKEKILNPLSNWLQRENKIRQTQPTPTPSASTPTSAKTKIKKIPTSKPPSTTKAGPQKSLRKECYRYTITHLDGSTSTLCYTKSDYNQLVKLGYQLQSAQTFYQFYLDGIKDYQDQYEITHSNIYLDAQESMRRKADREKEKIGEIMLKMQEIEKRGY